MDAYKTHGAFSWNELMTTDTAAAADFYAGLFGWAVTPDDPQMGGYRVASVADTRIAGIMSPPAGAPPMPPRWGAYVTVDDVEASLAKCLALGGKSVVPPMDVPMVGRMAIIQDPQGAVLSIMQYLPAPG